MFRKFIRLDAKKAKIFAIICSIIICFFFFFIGWWLGLTECVLNIEMFQFLVDWMNATKIEYMWVWAILLFCFLMN